MRKRYFFVAGVSIVASLTVWSLIIILLQPNKSPYEDTYYETVAMQKVVDSLNARCPIYFFDDVVRVDRFEIVKGDIMVYNRLNIEGTDIDTTFSQNNFKPGLADFVRRFNKIFDSTGIVMDRLGTDFYFVYSNRYHQNLFTIKVDQAEYQRISAWKD